LYLTKRKWHLHSVKNSTGERNLQITGAAVPAGTLLNYRYEMGKDEDGNFD